MKAIANVKRRGDSIKKDKRDLKRDKIGKGEKGSKMQCVLRTLMNTELRGDDVKLVFQEDLSMKFMQRSYCITPHH